MPALVKTTTNKTATASFTTTWDEAIALHHALPKRRSQVREAYRIDNIEMRFINPWRGPNHTEFSLVVKLATGATSATVAAVTKWLRDLVRDFLKEYRKQHKGKSKQKRRASAKKNVQDD